MSETKVAAEKKHSSLARGLIAGFIGGVAGTAAKAFAERIFVPQPKPAPQELASAREAANAPTELAKATQSDAFRWGLGAVTGAAYGAIAEFYPEATVKLGAGFGLALESISHERAQPVQGARLVGCWPFLKLTCTQAQPAPGPAAEAEAQSAREQGSETASYVVYGVTTELVRRLVRRWL
jgi:putative membrane protein